MKDNRIIVLAKKLINYSCSLTKGEKVLIECIGLETPLVTELIKQTYCAGAIPFVTIKDKEVDRAILMGCTEQQMDMIAKYEGARMSDMDAFIGIRSGDNISALSDVPSEKMSIYNKNFWNKVHGQIRVPNTKWVKCLKRWIPLRLF
jgi:aminopeptidase